MTVYLVAKVVDVTNTPVASAGAFVIEQGNSTPMTATAQQGVYERPIPAGTSTVTLSVGSTGFYPATQDIQIDTSASPPTASFKGSQHLNVRGAPTVHNRGTDYNIEVEVVLGQLRDVTATVIADAQAAGKRTSLGVQNVQRFATPILNPSGSGVTLLNDGGTKSVDPGGPLLFAERISAPSLIAVVNPGWPVKTGPDAPQFRLHYHVFFHPTIPDTWTDDYPFGIDYLDLIARYVLMPWAANPVGLTCKALAYQNRADMAKSIFVFPVGNKDKGLLGIASQDALLRLLLELNYWYQRVRGAKYPRMPLGGSGISAFSSAAGYITNIMNGPKNPRFYDKVLRMVGIFDGTGVNAASVRQQLVAWHRNGQENRHLRIYTQKAAWQVFENDYPTATRTQGPQGAFELEGEGFTLLYTPLAFFQEINPALNGALLHQLFPAWFMEHAVTRSGFAPP